MARSVWSLRALVFLALFPFAAYASTAPTTPTFLLKWGQSGTAPGSFNAPSGIATDALGNVYVCDQFNHRIQKFDRLGNFVAQWGSSGSGPGQFNQPFGIAIDASGFAYVVDNGNRRVQKFTSAGAFVTTWGSLGSGDGQFSGPLGIALDAAGNVYVADQFNQRVQKFTSTGAFVTKWGSAGSGNGQFNIPAAVGTDASGNVYVVDNNNHRIQKFTSSGVYLAQWGGLGAGDGQFNMPIGVAVDGVGNVYVADRGNNRMQKFTAAGVFLTKWGTNGAGDGQFALPLGVTVDAAGNVYTTEQTNQRVQKFSGAGEVLSEAAPAFLVSWGGYFQILGIATDADGNVFVGWGGTLTKLSSTGALITQISLGDGVVDVATDPSGNVYVSTFGDEIQKYNNALGFVGEWGSPGSGNGQFSLLGGVVTDASGNVYVADQGNNRIQKFTNTGTFVTAWGSAGSGNGQFNLPLDVAVDLAGNVYVADQGNNRIQKLTSSGVYITQWGSAGSGDGQFVNPTGIHVDGAGFVYASDYGNNRIQKFTSTGTFVTAWGSAGSGNGQFSVPFGIAVDSAGNVYVVDNGNNRIQKFVAPAAVALVSDVRNDQGRQTLLRFLRSSGDAPGVGVTVTGYEIYRRNDPLPATPSGDLAPEETQLAGWTYLMTVPAHGESEYNVVAPTLVDATASSLEYSAFMVRAASDNPLTFYDSGIANGYSVDNLSPSSPAPLFAVYELGATHLHWTPSTAPDFESFHLYRGSSADFVPGPGNLIATTPDTGYADAGDAGSWYKLTAVDFNGNASPYAVVGPAQTVAADPPSSALAFALDGVRPVPTSGERMVVHFALASGAPATLELIDVTGRRVRSRSVGGLGAGPHAVDLAADGRVARGVWFVRLTQGPNEAVVRAVVLD